ncbi:hypothetical protein BJ912DRAFT_981255 [Pholiota molesta]|nr:hypothetical protein BJ912DRAFT_981255 [Pholiota molesta]
MATATLSSSSTQTSTFPEDRYRGFATPPAFSISSNEAISRAIEMAYERDFSHIPVLNKNRRPLGYVDVAKLKEQWEAGQANQNDKVSKYMTKFQRSSTEPYTTITPLSPLSDLEEFLKKNIFALVTDQDRKFVLAVATSQDLDNFVSRRGL